MGRPIGNIRVGSIFGMGGDGICAHGGVSSFPIDENYVLTAARYFERNPVRAGIVEKAWEYSWDSALAHLEGKEFSPLGIFKGRWDIAHTSLRPR